MKRILAIFICFACVFAYQFQEAGEAQDKDNEMYRGLSNVGKTLEELRAQYPEGELLDLPGGLPDAALVCFGEADSNIVYVLYGTQGDDYRLMDEADQNRLKCCGIASTFRELFPDVPDMIPISDFMNSIGVSEYLYEDEIIGSLGWLTFIYDGNKVYINTNEIVGSGWDYTGRKEIQADAPIAIINEEIEIESYLIVLEALYGEDSVQYFKFISPVGQ